MLPLGLGPGGGLGLPPPLVAMPRGTLDARCLALEPYPPVIGVERREAAQLACHAEGVAWQAADRGDMLSGRGSAPPVGGLGGLRGVTTSRGEGRRPLLAALTPLLPLLQEARRLLPPSSAAEPTPAPSFCGMSGAMGDSMSTMESRTPGKSAPEKPCHEDERRRPAEGGLLAAAIGSATAGLAAPTPAVAVLRQLLPPLGTMSTSMVSNVGPLLTGVMASWTAGEAARGLCSRLVWRCCCSALLGLSDSRFCSPPLGRLLTDSGEAALHAALSVVRDTVVRVTGVWARATKLWVAAGAAGKGGVLAMAASRHAPLDRVLPEACDLACWTPLIGVVSSAAVCLCTGCWAPKLQGVWFMFAMGALAVEVAGWCWK